MGTSLVLTLTGPSDTGSTGGLLRPILRKQKPLRCGDHDRELPLKEPALRLFLVFLGRVGTAKNE